MKRLMMTLMTQKINKWVNSLRDFNTSYEEALSAFCYVFVIQRIFFVVSELQEKF